MNVHHATDVIAEAIGIAAEELDGLIDRHFAAHRTLTVEQESADKWVAELSGRVLYRSPDPAATIRFARTFAERHAGVTVAVQPAAHGYSLRVPDNVVPFPVQEGASA